MRAQVFRIATKSPSDVSGLEALFDRGALRPEDVVAVLGKTEGNGGRNDFTRELAVSALTRLFAARLGIDAALVEDPRCSRSPAAPRASRARTSS